MAEKLDPKEMASLQEILMTIMYAQDALINLLDKEGLVTKQELLEEIKRLKKEAEKKLPHDA